MNPAREIIDDGALAVSGDRIEAVGKTAELRSRYPAADEVDLTGHIVMPGLVDTHVHLAQTMLRGVSEGKRLADFSNWLFARIFPLQGSYTEADARASARLGVLEMLKSGTTGFVECLLSVSHNPANNASAAWGPAPVTDMLACPEQLDLVMLVSPSTSEILDAVSGAEFLVSERSKVIDASIIEAGRGLRLIQRLGLQVHDINLDAARQARIPVCRWPLPQCTMVGEDAVMQMMALLKRSREAARIVAEASDEWGPPERCDADTFLIDWSKMSGVHQLRDCTVGMVGLGEIGTELALRLGSFGCELLYYRRNRLPSWAEEQLQIAYAGLDDLLGRSNVVVLLLPHSPDTAGIADDGFLRRLRPGSLLVNAGASSLLDEEAVARAYRAGHLGGVATDGFAWEPVRPDNPLAALAADQGANVVLTPHSAQAGLVLDTAARRAEYTNLLAVIEGRPLLHRIA